MKKRIVCSYKSFIKVILMPLSFIPLSSSAQVNMWTVMGNDTTQDGNFFVQGAYHPNNFPFASYEFCQWKDNDGNFWIFGGYGGTYICNMWQFNPVLGQWKWVAGQGSSLNNIYCDANYGSLNITSPQNRPGNRGFGTPTWTSKNGDLYLFSGIGGSSDLWKYNIASDLWTWINGSASPSTWSSISNINEFSISNYPSTRSETDGTWIDSLGNLWLYGGANLFLAPIQDLWVYDIGLNQWACVDSGGLWLPPVNGEINLSSPQNMPGSRWVYCTWKNPCTDEFYMFSGGNTFGGSFNDVWKYNRFSNEWTRVSGSLFYQSLGFASDVCEQNVNNQPATQMENRARCLDKNNRLWTVCSTEEGTALWVFDMELNQWIMAWEGVNPNGNDIINSLGTPDPLNIPGVRGGAALWCDVDGNLWYYGAGSTNTMWKFIPDYECLERAFDDLALPNVFTPNNDGVNDVLIIPYNLENYDLQIFNRWGNLVFKSNDFSVPWNGENLKGELCSEGVYYYTIQGTKCMGTPITKSQSVHLIR